jgi:hypothetical protein
MTESIQSLESSPLEALSRALSDWYGRPPARGLHSVRGPRVDDGLLVIGILGGKEVGKTSLINALAGRTVSVAADPFEGTANITVFVHTDDVDACRQRLARGRVGVTVPHEYDALRHVVLLDLPDFDSDFLDHAAIVTSTLPLLDRVVWMVSHEKYANQSLIELIGQCAHDPDNYLFVINKLDVIAAAHGEDAAREMIGDFANKLSRGLNFNGQSDASVFGISATRRTFDFDRLSKRLLAPVDAGEIRQTHDANRKTAFDRDVQTLRASFAVRDDLAVLDAVSAELIQAAEALANRWVEHIEIALADQLPLADEWGREAFRLRLAHWPLISLPFGSTLIMLGRLVGVPRGQLKTANPEDLADGLFDPDGAALRDHLVEAWQDVRASRPQLPPLLRLNNTEAYPWQPAPCAKTAADLKDAFVRHVDAAETEFLRGINDRAKRGGFLKWCAIVIPLMWFPIVQPILEAFLAAGAEPTSGLTWLKIAYTTVVMLSASHWLKSLGVLAAVYGLVAMAVYARARRAARRQMQRLTRSELPPMLRDGFERGLTECVEPRRHALAGLAKTFDELDPPSE